MIEKSESAASDGEVKEAQIGRVCQVSIILPTYNEAENIRAVVASIQEELRATPDHEIVVVDDDSPDETWRIVQGLSREDKRIRCNRRVDRRGLASAIVDGLLMAEGDHLVVMDADLQHTPAVIPELISRLEKAEIVVASRYAPGGSTGSWGPFRRWASRLATSLGRLALGLSVTDPMSGFFALRRQTFQSISHRLRPRGFKALIEILFHAQGAKIAEVPYRFNLRQSGTSKLGRTVILDYLRSLVELRVGRLLASRFVRYCLVGLSGVVVQLVVLAALLTTVEKRLALALAILIAMISNFVLNNVWAFEGRRLARWAFDTGLLQFILISAVGAFLNHFVSMRFHQMTGVALVWSSLAGIAVATLWNYQLNSRITWPRKSGDSSDRLGG